MPHHFNPSIRSSLLLEFLLLPIITILLLAVMPLSAKANSAYVEVDYYPPGFILDDVTINVGESVHWQHIDLTGSPHWIKASDYEGRPCYDPTFVGGDTGSGSNTDGLLSVHEDAYIHFFPATPGNCYYRCIFFTGMEGVVRVIPVGGTTTTTTTTTRPVTTTTTTRPVTTTTTTTTTRPTTTTTTTTLPNQPPNLDSLTPVNISTVPSVAQSFTAGYSDPDGYQNIIDASLALSGSVHSETLHYNPATNRFTLQGVGGDCSPGQATTLSNAYLTLNCASSSASGSGNNLTLTYNLTPQPPISGAGYRLILGVIDQGAVNKTKDMGFWVVNRPPHADSIAPMNSTTTAGTQQTFVSVYSDPDGYQNIAEANFYMAGGLHNEWLHYVSAANIFFIMGAPGVCTPGQATTLSNGYLTLNCATSTVSGSGTVLTVTFRVTPLAPSSGINYNIFTGVSDQAGAAHGLFAGTWNIQ